MPTYHLKLYGNYYMEYGKPYERSVNVPRQIRGLSDVADYICDTLALDYAEGNRESPAYQNYYDTHIDLIKAWLEELRDNIREKRET